ncbi:MAG: GNAT family N-acetyltransferase [Anaerolineae bacterium]|jgi:GNAT superfamily N-acetyltransferase
MDIDIRGPFLEVASVCEPILRALPQWFGIEEATAQYIRDTNRLPTLLAAVGDRVVGFLTLNQHSDYAAEIHVMAVHPDFHRQGIGRALLAEAEQLFRAQGVEYLQVKTLSPAHPDPHYARTRRFYLVMGFRPLEEFPELWGSHNPCLQMIKCLIQQPATKRFTP